MHRTIIIWMYLFKVHKISQAWLHLFSHLLKSYLHRIHNFPKYKIKKRLFHSINLLLKTLHCPDQWWKYLVSKERMTQKKRVLCSRHKPECSQCPVTTIRSWDLIKVIKYETSSMALKKSQGFTSVIKAK